MAAVALLFDIDCILIESLPWYAGILGKLCNDGEDTFLERLASGEPAHKIAEQSGISRKRFLRACSDSIEQLRVFPEVHETLLSLRRRSTALGIVTNLSPSVADVLLRGARLDKLFDTILGAGRAMPLKPSPIPLLLALEKMGYEPGSNVYYIGDEASDRKAAKAAGISFAWAGYGSNRYHISNVDVVLESFKDILSL